SPHKSMPPRSHYFGKNLLIECLIKKHRLTLRRLNNSFDMFEFEIPTLSQLYKDPVPFFERAWRPDKRLALGGQSFRDRVRPSRPVVASLLLKGCKQRGFSAQKTNGRQRAISIDLQRFAILRLKKVLEVSWTLPGPRFKRDIRSA